jgi:ribosomal protein S18 acetylase RimI-like enzyme
MADRIRRAGPADAGAVAPLFDAYRRFYGRPPDLELARRFVAERLERGESVIFLAERDGRAVGFVQLYPVFSSTAARPGRLWLLNDLYVAPEARRGGLARDLMAAARHLAEETGACGLELVTGRTNAAAQRLYRSLGWHQDDAFVRFELGLDS